MSSTRGGGGRCQTFSFFPCSADDERDWPPCKVVFFGLVTNALNVRNNKQQLSRREFVQLSIAFESAHKTLIGAAWLGLPSQCKLQILSQPKSFRTERDKN